MASPAAALTTANDHIVKSLEEQIRELQPGLEKQVEMAAVLASLSQLQSELAGLPPDPSITKLIGDIIQAVTDIQSGKATLSDFGSVLVALNSLQQLLVPNLAALVQSQQLSPTDQDKLQLLMLDGVVRVRQLLNYRPDVGAIMDDLTAIKSLRGGPADAVAFHDFHVLQLAFKSVWLHAFDDKLKGAAEQLFEETVKVYADAGIPTPPLDAIEDINQLQDFLTTVKSTIGQSSDASIVPADVVQAFPTASAIWNLLSGGQRFIVYLAAELINNPDAPQDQKDYYRNKVAEILAAPDGPVGRLSRLMFEIDRALNEPYAFDVFAPDSYNYGLMVTYRQKWEPEEYQAGDLAATVPLAPGETRKYSKKTVVKKSRAVTEIEKSMSSRSLQSSETSRAESEIMQRATTATNFKMTAHGSFNIGVGSIDSTTDFSTNQEQISALTKKAFHEATLKAAEEYRLERSLQVNTSISTETEEVVSGEISNPNNELTVTYLFYELQRRFKVREFLYRVRPVILVAQDVPSPHEIDEAWLVQYQWILSRVLLDDSLRPALDYLSSGFAGDEVSIEVIKAQWEAQQHLTASLENQVNDLLAKRDWLRDALVSTQKEEDVSKTFEMSTALKVFTFGLAPDPAQMNADQLEAARKAYETRLQYSEQALADAQDKLKQASDSFRQATKEYATAMQNQYARHVAIDQLRIHVKQNIMYYMQAIWDQEPPDQRFFRLYNKTVICPSPQPCVPIVKGVRPGAFRGSYSIAIKNICAPGGVAGPEHDLIEVADLDNPLGYKGNYIIFPLKDQCYLTTYMLTQFIDNYLGVSDPDGSDNFDAEQFDSEWNQAIANRDQGRQDDLRKQLIDYITAVRRSTDEVIVPTGQLFIEALPGSHPLLEDFKLMHRFEDVRKVKAEVRHAELENLRLAARLVAGQTDSTLLEDPDIEKKTVIEGNASVTVGK